MSRRRGSMTFSGQNDIAEYIRMAQQEGLNVILRPGPYVCAEWDLGGYPAWLLADSTHGPAEHATAIHRAQRHGGSIGSAMSSRPLLASHGGPIIAVQVENEYGSFDKDKAYLAWQRDALRHAGFGSVRLYTADGDVQLRDGTLPDLPAVVNFGTGEADSAFARLGRFEPGQPLMSGEYWAGWFDQWGGRHAHTDAARQAGELDWMLGHGYSVNLYMFHGGTTFGFMNGANIDGGRYHPQTTSYDYDAALDESGRPTPKYFAVPRRHHQTWPVPRRRFHRSIPRSRSRRSGSGRSVRCGGRWRNRCTSAVPRAMETFGQGYGYILYRTRAALGVARPARDSRRARLCAGLCRRQPDRHARPATWAGQCDPRRSGRCRATRHPGRKRRAGEFHQGACAANERESPAPVTINGELILGWDVFPLPMTNAPVPRSGRATSAGPAFYRGEFTAAKPGDTFLDTRGWGKGAVWVNGHALGRFWDIGPQETLYVPDAWLRKGRNDVVVFDMLTPRAPIMSGLLHPVWQ